MPLPLGDSNGAANLIFDWNALDRSAPRRPPAFGIVDQTLRDGLQSPSVEDPSIDDKLRILHLMEDLGVEAVDVGLPASSPRAFDDALALCTEVGARKLGISVVASARTIASDIAPIIEMSQRAAIPIEACIFIGSSPIRHYVERWDLTLIAKRSAEAIDFAVRSGLRVSYVTEDTTRSRPEALATLFRAAIDHGATRLCLTDTVGHATPDGVRRLLGFTERVIAESGAAIGVDWHGHNDRGLALDNALCALECGADRAHATALGIGERAGNTPLELLLLNLRLLGRLPESRSLGKLVAYCDTVAKALRTEIPPHHPVVGRNAFRTAAGVHAAAISKALQQGDAWLADRVYSGVPAGAVGRQQEICIGHMSGASNVDHWLRERGFEPRDSLVASILRAAKSTAHTLSDREVLDIVERENRTRL